MKTLKTFFVLLAMVITSSGYAQTKEETIEWLNTNGSVLSKTYLRGSGDRDKYDRIDIQFSKIKNDTVEFFSTSNDDHNSYKDQHLRVSLSSILYQDVNTLPKETFSKNSSYGYFIIKLLPESGSKVAPGDIEEKVSTFYIAYSKDNEENVKRVLKAIMYLAKLSGAKENKQTF